jgi:hypothetical protein
MYSNLISINATSASNLKPDGNLAIPYASTLTSHRWPSSVASVSNFNRTPGTYMANLTKGTTRLRWLPIAHSADAWSLDQYETVGLLRTSDYHPMNAIIMMFTNESTTAQTLQLNGVINYEIRPALTSLAYQSMTPPNESGSHQQTLSLLSQQGVSNPILLSDF